MTIQGTDKTPSVIINLGTGEFKFSGVSIPENSVAFYKPVMKKLDEYINSPQKITTVTFNLEYLNSGTLYHVYQILEKLNDLHKSGKSNVLIVWNYEKDDTDIEDLGQDFNDSFEELIFELNAIE